jgi:hypothetical protein
LDLSLESLVARELLNTGAAKNMEDAVSKAVTPAKELIGWTQKQAIESPFI